MSARIDDNNQKPEFDLASDNVRNSIMDIEETHVIVKAERPPKNHPVDVREGTTLKDRFFLESLIATGGMGVVFKARDLRKIEAQDSNPYVAIKLLNKKFSARKNAIITLQRETRKSQILAHPNIITVHDFDRDGEVFLMTMEYLQGQPLSRVIKPNGIPTALPKNNALKIIESISNALIYAHSKNIIHCDLKPANIFITDEKLVKILDFGIARAIQVSDVFEVDESLNQGDGMNAMTLTYASYEMLDDKTPEPRDDIYSLACITYELLTGKHPFSRKSAKQAFKEKLKPKVVKSLTHKQWRALSSALSFKREQRPHNVKAFANDFFPDKRPSFIKTWSLPAIALIAMLTALTVYQNNFNLYSEPEMVVIPFSDLSQFDQEKVLSLLEIADAHMMVQRYTEPPGSNAFAAYSQIIKIHPGNPQALDGLKKIADIFAQLAQKHIDQNEMQTAMNFITEGLKINSSHESLIKLQKILQ